MEELEFKFSSDSGTHSCLACHKATTDHEKVRLKTNEIIAVGRKLKIYKEREIH